MEVKTRFAPSPTGLLHIGGVRTALYEYLVAKQNDGQFLLRIEDTDQSRLVDESVGDIIETLRWLGLNFEGEPIFQSARKKIYEEYAKGLVKKGSAYEQDGAVWFKIQKEGQTETVDLVGNRKLEIPNKNQKDFVILKSDGFPTYHLAHVVDDHLMGINPVIRGAEWISSLPKHVMLFKAFGWDVPSYAHLPIILGPDRSKLSKRHGAKPASEFRRDGFLPEAILNYMALLGWTPPGSKEILSIEEMIELFDLKKVHITNPIFDITKLEWMNGEYVRRMSDDELTKRLQEYLVDHPARDKIEPVVPLLKTRIKKLSDFVPLTDFLWEEPEYEREVFDRLKIKDLRLKTEKILGAMEKMEKPWKAEVFEKTFRQLADEMGLSSTEMFQLIRVAISGQTVTPPLFESIQILGEEKTFVRIKKALSIL